MRKFVVMGIGVAALASGAFWFAQDAATRNRLWDTLPFAKQAKPGEEPLKRTAQPNAPADIAAGYQLVWRDEFSGKKLDSTRWGHVTPGKARKGGFNDPESVTLDGNGNLHITLRQVGEEFHSGMISTQNKFEAKFGYYECRARMQTQVGFWSAFWLQGSHVQDVDKGLPDDTKVNGIECDVFEYLAKRPDGFQHAMHWSGYTKSHKSKGFRVNAPEMVTGWHTYGVEWRPDGYTFYLDGKKTWDFDGALSHTKQFLILSAEVGEWGGDIKTAKLPDDVAFDYVRVWSKPEANATASDDLVSEAQEGQ